MKRLGWLLTLALAAMVLALIVAPMLVQLVVLVGGAWAPVWPLRILSHVGYEGGLWGTGLGVFWVARRLGWLSTTAHAVTLVVAAPVCESVLAWVLGRVSPGFSTLPGGAVRLVVSAVAVAAAVALARRPLSS